ncbi:MAG: GxxExxY protein [Dysgonomonas sp.]|nr:GxxExxY protein [Dysgonomonas sp.]
MTDKDLMTQVVNAGSKIYRELGPGLFPEVYKDCFIYELKNRGLSVESQKAMSLVYETIQFESAYKIDILIENKAVINFKLPDIPDDLHKKYIETYIKHCNFSMGILINFNTIDFRDAIHIIEKPKNKIIAPSLKHFNSYYGYNYKANRKKG